MKEIDLHSVKEVCGTAFYHKLITKFYVIIRNQIMFSFGTMTSKKKNKTIINFNLWLKEIKFNFLFFFLFRSRTLVVAKEAHDDIKKFWKGYFKGSN